MRDYNSATDYVLIEMATRQFIADTTGGWLNRVSKELENAGIRWPAGFNSDTRPHVMQLDRDMCRAYEELKAK